VDMDDDVCIELNAHQKKERYNRQREWMNERNIQKDIWQIQLTYKR
jgi:hypothetical protein